MKEMRFRILVLKLLCMILEVVLLGFRDKDEARELYIDAQNLIRTIVDEMGG